MASRHADVTATQLVTPVANVTSIKCSTSDVTIFSSTEGQKCAIQRWLAVVRSSTSGGTRFRLRQRAWGSNDAWAIDNLYIGPQCVNHCRGHGRCTHGRCRWDTVSGSIMALMQVMVMIVHGRCIRVDRCLAGDFDLSDPLSQVRRRV